MQKKIKKYAIRSVRRQDAGVLGRIDVSLVNTFNTLVVVFLIVVHYQGKLEDFYLRPLFLEVTNSLMCDFCLFFFLGCIQPILVFVCHVTRNANTCVPDRGRSIVKFVNTSETVICAYRSVHPENIMIAANVNLAMRIASEGAPDLKIPLVRTVACPARKLLSTVTLW